MVTSARWMHIIAGYVNEELWAWKGIQSDKLLIKLIPLVIFWVIR